MEISILKSSIDKGLSTRKIAKEQNCSQSTVKHYLKKYDLKTYPSIRPKLTIDQKKKNSVKAVSNRRRKLKTMSIEYKGGKCLNCGYNKCVSALEFHHLDPTEKDFTISVSGNTKSWDKIKIELDKCILLCANCHREEHSKI